MAKKEIEIEFNIPKLSQLKDYSETLLFIFAFFVSIGVALIMGGSYMDKEEARHDFRVLFALNKVMKLDSSFGKSSKYVYMTYDEMIEKMYEEKHIHGRPKFAIMQPVVVESRGYRFITIYPEGYSQCSILNGGSRNIPNSNGFDGIPDHIHGPFCFRDNANKGTYTAAIRFR